MNSASFVAPAQLLVKHILIYVCILSAALFVRFASCLVCLPELTSVCWLSNIVKMCHDRQPKYAKLTSARNKVQNIERQKVFRTWLEQLDLNLVEEVLLLWW